MAVYNEKKVIRQKLQSIFHTNYPPERLYLLIGSDNSTDGTNEIIQTFQQKHQNIQLHIFEGRNGKAHILNQLAQKHESKWQKDPNTVLILTDANVLFTKNTLFELAKHYKNPKMGVVAANILNEAHRCDGIAMQEMWYIQRENDIKYREGIWGGCMMGAFGACYALRANLFRPIPPNFIVDDFYLTLTALEKKHMAIKELKAICYEDVSNDIWEEFRRKKRISAGNFQNLQLFAQLTHPKNGKIAFSFVSHKILRWFGCLFLLLAFFSNALLASQNNFYALVFSIQIILLSTPILDYLLKKVNIHYKIFRFISYFLLMNVALFIGFIHYLNGIQNNVWTPTKRQ